MKRKCKGAGILFIGPLTYTTRVSLPITYKGGEIPTQFFDHAERVLKRISDRQDSKLILFTCSHPHEIELYLEFFKERGIVFNYTNENPEAENTSYGFYEKKFYCQILLDDKAGFDATEDWQIIDTALDLIDEKYPSLK